MSHVKQFTELTDPYIATFGILADWLEPEMAPQKLNSAS